MLLVRASLVPFLLWACASVPAPREDAADADPTKHAQSVLCDDLVARACAARVRCCDVAEETAPCEEEVRACRAALDEEPSLREGRRIVDEDAVAALAEALDACRPVPPMAAKVVVGTRTAGQPCAHGDCTPGLGCAEGVCAPLAGRGDRCDARLCETGLVCAELVDEAPGPDGRFSTALRCMGVVGTPCLSDRECGTGACVEGRCVLATSLCPAAPMPQDGEEGEEGAS